MESILNSIKKLLGMAQEYEPFDDDIIIAINSAFSVLNQLGVGPSAGFFIEDDKALWSDFIGDTRLNFVKTYVYLKVKAVFDPPSSTAAINAVNSQITELEWRIKALTETGIKE